MRRGHQRDAVSKQKFWFRKRVNDGNPDVSFSSLPFPCRDKASSCARVQSPRPLTFAITTSAGRRGGNGRDDHDRNLLRNRALPRPAAAGAHVFGRDQVRRNHKKGLAHLRRGRGRGTRERWILVTQLTPSLDLTCAAGGQVPGFGGRPRVRAIAHHRLVPAQIRRPPPQVQPRQRHLSGRIMLVSQHTLFIRLLSK